MENENLILIRTFCMHHNVEPSFIISLEEYGLVSVFEHHDERYLSLDDIKEVETMLGFHYDLGINLEGIDAIINLLKKITALQDELTTVRDRMNTFAPQD